jgi:plastocyanin
MPNDVKVVNRPRRYRAAPPPYAVPILHPPKTPFRRTRTTKVDDEGFWPHRISVPSGKALTWNFRASMLHSVTVTAGPRGFSSPWTSNGSFSFTPRRKGTYQIFCSLHPSQMVQVVKVR